VDSTNKKEKFKTNKFIRIIILILLFSSLIFILCLTFNIFFKSDKESNEIYDENHLSPNIGDINLDQEVNGKDLILLKQYLTNGTKLSDLALANADYNKDGKVDSKDDDALSSYLANYDYDNKVVNATLYGDVNLDNVVNGKDLILLKQYLTNGTKLSDLALANADYNKDGKVDSKDDDALSSYLANYDYDNEN